MLLTTQDVKMYVDAAQTVLDALIIKVTCYLNLPAFNV